MRLPATIDGPGWCEDAVDPNNGIILITEGDCYGRGRLLMANTSIEGSCMRKLHPAWCTGR